MCNEVVNKKWEKTQITNTKNEKGGITTDSIDIKMLIKGNYEQHYINTFDSLNERS